MMLAPASALRHVISRWRFDGIYCHSSLVDWLWGLAIVAIQIGVLCWWLVGSGRILKFNGFRALYRSESDQPSRPRDQPSHDLKMVDQLAIEHDERGG